MKKQFYTTLGWVPTKEYDAQAEIIEDTVRD